MGKKTDKIVIKFCLHISCATIFFKDLVSFCSFIFQGSVCLHFFSIQISIHLFWNAHLQPDGAPLLDAVVGVVCQRTDRPDWGAHAVPQHTADAAQRAADHDGPGSLLKLGRFSVNRIPPPGFCLRESSNRPPDGISIFFCQLPKSPTPG